MPEALGSLAGCRVEHPHVRAAVEEPFDDRDRRRRPHVIGVGLERKAEHGHLAAVKPSEAGGGAADAIAVTDFTLVDHYAVRLAPLGYRQYQRLRRGGGVGSWHNGR